MSARGRTGLMASLAAAAAVALALLLLPSAAGQEFMQVLEDPVGDVQMEVEEAGVATEAPEGRYDSLDLVAAHVAETEGRFAFRLQVAALGQGDGQLLLLEGGNLFLQFTMHDLDYRVMFWQQEAVDGFFAGASLQRFDIAQERFVPVRSLEVDVDMDAATLTAWVDREDLFDSQGASPFPGRLLHGFRAESGGFANHLFNINLNDAAVSTGSPVKVWDRMPDSGEGDQGVEVQLGLRQSGHVRLSSDDPMRASNGEATTFVFKVHVHNHGDQEDRFRFQASGAPVNWQVRFPQPVVSVDADAGRTVPVLVTTPFAHQHGTVQSFVVEAESLSDRSAVGRVEIGIRYTEIPQPAGHHDTLYLHSQAYDFFLNDAFSLLFASNDGFAYMNALRQDSLDEGLPIAGSWWGTNPEGRTQHRWFVQLQPGLEIGLDFDMDRAGEFQGTIETQTPYLDASVTGRLVHLGPPGSGPFNWPYGNRNVTEIALLDATEPVDLPTGGEKEVVLTVTPLPEADLIPYEKGANLALELDLRSTRAGSFVGPDAPRLQPGGALRLPLFEYHDPVDQAFLSTLRLEARETQQRVANPGSVVLFEITLENGQQTEDRVHLDLTGTHADWARLHGSEHVRVGAGSSAKILVVVEVPVDARHGEPAEVWLEAHSSVDESAHALLRLLVTVDLQGDHPDDRSLLGDAGGDRRGPAPAAALLLAALAVVAGVARRRRTRSRPGPFRQG